MSHLSIAIIRRVVDYNSVNNDSNNDSSYEYLVLEDTEAPQRYKFFDHKPQGVIGDSFEYSKFKDKVVAFLHLDALKDDVFECSPSPFRKIDIDEPATSYMYQLKRTSQIDALLKTHTIGQWKSTDELAQLKTNWKKSQQFIFSSEKPFVEVNFSNELRTDLQKLRKAMQINKLVVFAGAGVSRDSGLPDWKSLISSFQSEINQNEKDPLKVAQMHLEQRRRKENIDTLKTSIKYKKTRANLIHKQIVTLNPFHIITTNYDDHFEQVINQDLIKYSIVKKDGDLPDSESNSLLLKMHGDIDEKNVVLTQSDYDTYPDNFPLIKGFVEGVLATHLVLFVGFSFDDPNLTELLGRVNNILKGDYQPPYLLFISDDKSGEREDAGQINELRNKGLKVVTYEDNSLIRYFSEYCELENSEHSEYNELGEIGKKVFRFLKVLEKYDAHDDDYLFGAPIENQLLNSLSRFEGLNALPINVLKTMVPFRTLKSHFSNELDADFSDFTLSVLNEGFLSYLHPEGANDPNFFIDDSSLSTKMQKAFELIYNSAVVHIVRKNDLTYPKITLKYRSTESCSCLRCKTFDFDYREVLISLEQGTLSTSGSLIEFMCNIYASLKTGQFVKAYYLLEQIKDRLRVEQGYVLFFVCSLNQRLIRNHLNVFNEPNIKEKKFIEIKTHIDRIDLDSMIVEMPVHEDVKRALYIIKDNTVLSEAKRTIKENKVQILNLYKSFQHEGFFSFGPNYWFRLHSEFYITWNFYRMNFLFYDEYSEFKELALDYVEAMIASNMVSEKYQQRMNSYNPFIVRVISSYLYPGELKDIFLRYKLLELKFDSDEIVDEVIRLFSNLVSSGFDESDFLSYQVTGNELFLQKTPYLSFFSTRVYNQFSCLMLLMTKIDLSKEQSNQTLTKSLNFLSVSNLFNTSGAHEFFLDFVHKYINDFSDSNIVNLVKYSIADGIWIDPIVKSVCGALINIRNYKSFIDETLYGMILNRINHRKKHSAHLADIMPFYQLLIPDLRSNFYELIKKEYSKDSVFNGGVNPFYELFKWGVWNPIDNHDFFEMFFDAILKDTKRGLNFDLNEDIEPVGINSYAGLNELYFFVRLIYKYNLNGHDYVDVVYNQIKSDLFKWALKPNEFDYTNFDYKWLAYIEIEEFYSYVAGLLVLQEEVKKQLQLKFNAKVASAYFKIIR